jgi:hypothetical protein
MSLIGNFTCAFAILCMRHGIDTSSWKLYHLQCLKKMYMAYSVRCIGKATTTLLAESAFKLYPIPEFQSVPVDTIALGEWLKQTGTIPYHHTIPPYNTQWTRLDFLRGSRAMHSLSRPPRNPEVLNHNHALIAILILTFPTHSPHHT